VSTPDKVDIWSDIACPWCYIGKRKFETAVRAFSDGERTVEVEFHSFELSPGTPVDFEGSEIDFLADHKGMPADQVKQMLEEMTHLASTVGLSYDFDAVRHTNTVLAHQLLHHAKANGRQEEMKERLLKAYFEQGRHVGRVGDLADLAAEVGLDRDEAVRVLTEQTYLDDVNADKKQAIEYGITGVPFFVVDGRYGVSGAQSPDTFQQVLNQAWDERR
jgi:predicted DsbA family dithiol-disulfide isomerase